MTEEVSLRHNSLKVQKSAGVTFSILQTSLSEKCSRHFFHHGKSAVDTETLTVSISTNRWRTTKSAYELNIRVLVNRLILCDTPLWLWLMGTSSAK
jgi:hypothetical protein